MRAALVVIAAVPALSGAPAAAHELHRRHVLRGHKQRVDAVAVSRDGTTVASLANAVDTKPWQRWAELRIWDTTTGKPVASFASAKGPIDSVNALALSPDGKRLAGATQAGRLVLWSVAERREIAAHAVGGSNASVAFSADGKKLAMATEYTMLRCDGEAGANATIVKSRTSLFGGGFTPDLRWRVRFFYQDVDFIDPTTGKLDRTLPDHPGTVSRIAFSSAGKHAAVIVSTHDDQMNYRSEIVVWDVASAKRSAHLKGIGVCRYAAFAVDDHHLALLTAPELLSDAYELNLVELPSGKAAKAIRFPRHQSPWCAASSGDGRILTVGCRDGSVQVFEVK